MGESEKKSPDDVGLAKTIAPSASSPPAQSTLASPQGRTTGPESIGHANTEIALAAPDGLASIPPHVRVSVPSFDFEEGFASRYEYESSSVLGHGGMGEVRICRDKRIGREVAMKVVHGKYDKRDRRDEMKERFLREARVQGQLEHPAVVPVYDMGRLPDGEPYFTMKRVRGVTLERIVDLLKIGDDDAKKKYSPRKLLTAMTSLCLALEFVHGRGVVHRDLKPANVMLGDFGEVYLLDWGLAKILGTTVDDTLAIGSGSGSGGSGLAVTPSGEKLTSAPSALTSAGALMGTPGYMPREQLVGHVLDIDPRADVYALGSILFELLTLERLHACATTKDVIQSTMDGADARASVRAPSREVPPELEAICVKATATSPADRFASAREMSDAIERYLDGDRDVQQRRDMALRHARAAEQAVGAAFGSDRKAAEASRRTAMRELSRALALDPENPATMRAMVRLFMEPPRELPTEVKAELEQLSRDQVRLGGKTGGFAFLSLNLYLPIVLAMGIRSPWVWSTYALAVVTAVLSFGIGRSKQPRTRHAMAVFVVSLVCVATLSGMVGPYILVPSVIATSTLVFATTNDRSLRGLIIALGSLAIVIPVALELAGIVPPSMRFTSEGILLLPRTVDFPPVWTQIFLAISAVAVVITSGLALAPFRDELDEAQRRIRLFAWHLRELVPKDAVARETKD